MRRLVSAAPVQSLSSRSASVRSTGGGSTMMLKLAVFLTLVTVCFTQPPVPKIAESFTSSVSRHPPSLYARITCAYLLFPLRRAGQKSTTLVEPSLAHVRARIKIFHATSYVLPCSIISFFCFFSCSCY